MEERRDIRLAAFAHDLRTPMCCVAGAAQMALDAEKQGKDVSEQLRQILQAVQAMDTMLERMMQPEACSAFTAAMLEREIYAACGVQAKEKNQKLSINLSGAGGRWMKLDYGALTRVLDNLVGNAIKFTPEGGEISVRAQIMSPIRHGGSLRIRFVIADNGMGMKRAFLSRMYVPYVRSEEGAHLPGKGLGLAIVRSLVLRMNGSIRVKSEWGKGTIFTVEVPVSLQFTEVVS